jgi:hypothetical protein
MQRSLSSSSTPTLKHRAPSLPVNIADPLNALPVDNADSALKSLAAALEGSYKLIWSKVQLPDPPKTLDDVRRLIQRPFINDEGEVTEKSNLNKLIVGTGTGTSTGEHKLEERGNIMYFHVGGADVVLLVFGLWGQVYPDRSARGRRRRLQLCRRFSRGRCRRWCRRVYQGHKRDSYF